MVRRRTDDEREGDREAARLASALGASLRDGRRRRRLKQAEPAERVGVSRARIGQLEAGWGASAPLRTWVRIGMALGRPFAAGLSREIGQPSAPADSGHLAGQELVLRLARLHGRTGLFELSTRNSARDGGNVDVGVRDDLNRALILVEVWNLVSDLGNATRTSGRKVAEASDLAMFRGYRVALCWLFVDTAANRMLVRRYPQILRARFRGSSVAWAKCLTNGEPPPPEPGLAWVDPRSGRVTPVRLRG